uniref:Uncharacterized protein n=1 Tax=Lactuca sativa TaxID=4236 RepID=A0A9R1WU41_LACSA|nr:hypothetical protein LSAT_V11C900493130 [Lactuca sativa]
MVEVVNRVQAEGKKIVDPSKQGALCSIGRFGQPWAPHKVGCCKPGGVMWEREVVGILQYYPCSEYAEHKHHFGVVLYNHDLICEFTTPHDVFHT